MDGFTFYGEYYETIKKVKKLSDRQAILIAIVEFVFEDKEPNGLSEVAEIVFETLRKKLAKSKNNAGRGGRKKQNRIETDCKPIVNRLQTELKPISNGNEKRLQNGFKRESPLKEVPLNEKERSKEKENIYPEEINPQENVQRTCARVGSDGQGENKAQADFFVLYPKIKVDNYSPSEYAGIDFELLIKRFEESEFLRGTHSFSWICKHYPKIAAGEYKDFEARRRTVRETAQNALGEEWNDLY